MKKIFVEIEVPEGDYCGDCHWIMPKETAQTKKKEHHICHLYNMRVLHYGEHPRLPKITVCLNAPSPMACGHHPAEKSETGCRECFSGMINMVNPDNPHYKKER